MLCTILLTQSCWRVFLCQWKCNRPNQVTLTWRSTTGVTSWRWLFFSQERGGTLSPSWTWMWTQAGSGVHSLAREAEQEVPEGGRERERERWGSVEIRCKDIIRHPEGGGGVQFQFRVVQRSELGLRLVCGGAATHISLSWFTIKPNKWSQMNVCLPLNMFSMKMLT